MRTHAWLNRRIDQELFPAQAERAAEMTEEIIRMTSTDHAATAAGYLAASGYLRSDDAAVALQVAQIHATLAVARRAVTE